MSLPEWANGVFEQFKPGPAYGSDEPDERGLSTWQAVRQRFETRWPDLKTDKWGLSKKDRKKHGFAPKHGLQGGDPYLCKCVLECAVEAAMQMADCKPPDQVLQAVRELDSLNDRITEHAGNLADLFRQRNQLQADYGISDHSPEWYTSDPFNLWQALEEAMALPSCKRFKYVARNEAEAFFKVAKHRAREGPDWADVLDTVAARSPRQSHPRDHSEQALAKPGTNKSEYSEWGRKLIAMLDTWGGLPDGVLLDCLTNPQLATLAEVAFNVPAGVFNDEQIRGLKKRYINSEVRTRTI